MRVKYIREGQEATGVGERKRLLTSGQVKAEIAEGLSWWSHTSTEGEGDGDRTIRKESVVPGEWHQLNKTKNVIKKTPNQPTKIPKGFSWGRNVLRRIDWGQIITTDVGRNCKVMEKNKWQADNVPWKSQRGNRPCWRNSNLGKNAAWLGRRLQ